MMKLEINKFLTIMYGLQKINPEFPLQYSICLSEIAQNEGMSLTDLADKTGMSLSTISRITSALSTQRKSRKSYDLIKVTIAPQERRRKQLFLSPHGHEVMKSIANSLQ